MNWKTSLFVNFLFILFIDANGNLPHWWWSYTCTDGKCVKSTDPKVNKTVNIENLLNVCRLTCGRYGSLWPRPTGETIISDKTVIIHPDRISFSIYHINNKVTKNFLYESIKIFKRNILTECNGNCSVNSTVEVNVQISISTNDLALNWTTNEEYSLKLESRGNLITVNIEAITVYGARHGLETLSQLIAGYQLSENVYGLVITDGAKITDKPIYQHRGLLLDTSRHFFSMATLKRTIDAMAASKLNVFHWHATDSHSFPLELPSVPLLARYGAYSSKEIYSVSDINELLAYAKQRGIKVLLEIDGPAHAGNGWQWGPQYNLGDLAVCLNYQPWQDRCVQPPCGQLNPSNPNVFKVMEDLFKDIVNIFTESKTFFHMGGDEVDFRCWNSTDSIINWMKDLGLGRSTTDFLEIWGKYQEALLKVWDEQIGHDKTPIILWSSKLTNPSVIEKHLSKDRYIIESWVKKSDPLPDALLSKGYKLIFATKDAWYLDHGFWGKTEYYHWNTVYDNSLPRGNSAVLGGEIAMWGELVDDYSIDARVWPRAAAMAERLWSDPDEGSKLAQTRIFEHRERLIRRGVNAEAITPEWCYFNDGDC